MPKSVNYTNLIKELGENRVRLKENLASHTSIRIGGPAELFFEAETIDDLIKAVGSASRYKIPFFILGGGTNLIISNKGFSGLVIKNKTSLIQPIKIQKRLDDQLIYLKVESGVFVNRLVRYSLEESLSGLEHFLGQPGTIGGAVWINAHNTKAKVFFSDLVVEADLLDRQGKVRNVSASYFKFGYDKSLLQKTQEVVLSVVIKLRKNNHKQLWEKAKQALEYRRVNQPYDFPSAGCVFQNISINEAEKIGTPKKTTSCGYLIESVGLKGYQIGGAQFSDKHAAFIINTGKATADDVKALINIAKNKIRDKYGLEIKEEVVLVGDF